ncbi:MAG: CRP/FNR family cyclic AMP-dependent transcriptional regulator [Porticoccaceae bacterium]|jgi:CRP/FNR family cyclic AMP-dependent transcriptional regulator
MLFFDLLTPFQKEKAIEFGAISAYPARTLIIRQGERANGIHVIIDGIVESVFYTDKDRELCLANWGEHDFVGAPHIFGDSVQQWSARALTDVEILHLNQDQLGNLVRSFPNISICLIQALGQKGERYSELAQRLAFHTVQERLALTLLDTWKDAVINNATVSSLPVPSALALSRSIGSTRQAVGHAMRSLSTQGLIRIDCGRFSLPHIQALKEFSGCGMTQYSLTE